MGETAGDAWTAHSAERVATHYMAATEAGMTATETTMAAEAATVSTTETASVSAAAALRPHGYSQEKRERRDGHQAAHTRTL